jgi:hypothetical protein
VALLVLILQEMEGRPYWVEGVEAEDLLMELLEAHTAEAVEERVGRALTVAAQARQV